MTKSERLRELIAKATKGPWRIQPETGDELKKAVIRDSDNYCQIAEFVGSCTPMCDWFVGVRYLEANVKMVAESRTALPELLDLVEQMADELEVSLAAIKAHTFCYDEHGVHTLTDDYTFEREVIPGIEKALAAYEKWESGE